MGISQPVILRSKKAPDRTQTINNIKQVGAMLLEFDADYGKFPDDETALEVKRQNQHRLHPHRPLFERLLPPDAAGRRRQVRETLLVQDGTVSQESGR